MKERQARRININTMPTLRFSIIAEQREASRAETPTTRRLRPFRATVPPPLLKSWIHFGRAGRQAGGKAAIPTSIARNYL
jgi:hypothetical protein